MNKPNNRGCKRLINAFFFSMKGFQATFKNEQAFRQELYLLILVVPLAFYLSESGLQLALYLGSYLLILMAELINSAIESVVDRIGKEIDPLSGQAKDIGSAIVFIAIIMALVVWAALILF